MIAPKSDTTKAAWPRAGEEDRRKIVFTGGFSAGKSAAINLLVRSKVITSDVGLRDQPLQRVYQSQSPSAVSKEEIDGLHGPEILQQVDLPTLAEIEIVEIPAAIEGEFDDQYLSEFKDASLVVWCTIGSQAWRLSEKSAVEDIREIYSGPLVLAVMRSDLFRSLEDMNKVKSRLKNDRSDLFSDIVFLGASRTSIAEANDTTTWRASGGHLLAKAVDAAPKRPRLKPAEQPPKVRNVAEVVPFPPATGVTPDLARVGAQRLQSLSNTPEIEQVETPLTPKGVLAAKLAPLWQDIRALPGLSGAAIMDLANSRMIVTHDIDEALTGGLVAAGQVLLMDGEPGDQAQDAIVTRSRDYLLYQSVGGSLDMAVFVKVKKSAALLGSLQQTVRNIAAKHVAAGLMSDQGASGLNDGIDK